MRRGLTLIELLVSLGLLGTLMVACGTWVGVTARVAAEAADPAQWDAVAEAVRRRIHEDLLIGDTLRGVDPRVQVVNGILEIRTRATGFGDVTGPVVHRYRLDRHAGRLEVEERAADGRRVRRRLLEGVREFRCEIDAEERTLVVLVEALDCAPREWRVPVP